MAQELRSRNFGNLFVVLVLGVLVTCITLYQSMRFFFTEGDKEQHAYLPQQRFNTKLQAAFQHKPLPQVETKFKSKDSFLDQQNSKKQQSIVAAPLGETLLDAARETLPSSPSKYSDSENTEERGEDSGIVAPLGETLLNAAREKLPMSKKTEEKLKAEEQVRQSQEKEKLSISETADPSQGKVISKPRADSPGSCGQVTGAEEGFWEDLPSGIRMYDLEQCTLRRYNQPEARECLKDSHIVFIGDSLTRYQYQSFVYLLNEGWPEGLGNSATVFNPCKEAWGQGGWGVYYRTTSEQLNRHGGSELCDCYRMDGPMSQTNQRTLRENRFFHLKSHNISVSYLQLFGKLPMRGHFPGDCRGGIKKTCDFSSMTKENLAKNGHRMEEEEFNSLKETKFDWSGDLRYVLQNVIPPMGVDTMFVNNGLWAEYEDDNEMKEIMELGNAAVVSNKGRPGKCIWKRTTTKLVCHKSSKKCMPTDKKELFHYNDTLPVKYAPKYNWDQYDVAKPTSTLPWNAWNDEVHYKPYVYKELNTILFNMVCPASEWKD